MRRLAVLLFVAGGLCGRLFAQCPTTPPNPQSPSNGATNVPVTPTLTWSNVNNATAYDIAWSKAGAGACTGGGFLATSTTTSFTPPQLDPGTGYEWRVKARNPNVCSDTAFSSCFTFTTVLCNHPGPFSTTAPANGDTVGPAPTLSWTAATNADKYVVHIGTTNPPSPTANDPKLSASNTSYKPSSLPAGTYYWYVDALPACATTTAPNNTSSPVSSFKVVACPTAAPSLLAPAAGATLTTSSVTFQWSAVSGASSYRLWISVDGGARVILGNLNATSMTATVPKGTITWLVEAQFNSCPSTFSPTSTFTAAATPPCSNAAPTLLSPANGATGVDSPVEFKWSAVPGATSYSLYIGTDLAGTTTDSELTRLVPSGTVSWTVVASFAGCPDVKSSTFTFTVKGDACGGNVSPTSPANGATVSAPVALAWSSVSGATVYRVWAAFNGSAPAVITRTTATTASLPLPAGKIEWFVEALFASCPSILSAHSTFTVQAAASCGGNQPATLTAPANGAANLDSPVKFTWSGNAPLYRLWVSSNGDPFADLGATTKTELDRDVAPGPTVWFVESFFDGCSPLPSAKSAFTVEGAANCGTTAPVIVSPADGATNVASPVTLTWTPVPDAEEYRVWASLDGGDVRLVGESETPSLTRTLPPGLIVWYVEAELDECPYTRSATAKFNITRNASCPTAAPELVSPANETNLQSEKVLLDWNPVSGAVGYAVFARHSDGAPTRLGETIDSQLEHRLPPGEIEWWVTAFFNGCDALESQHGHFDILETENCNRTVKPLLQNPPDSATPTASPVEFSWSAVPEATQYKVWASIGGAGASVISTTTARKVTLDVPSGAVMWFVEADFASCPAAYSIPGNFLVQKSAPLCATPTRPVARVAAQVASGSEYNLRWTPVANVSKFEVQEASATDFANATTTIVAGHEAPFTHDAAVPVRWYYRVRAISDCSDVKSAESRIVSVVVIPLANAQRHTTVEVGTTAGLTQKITLPGQTPPVSFSAHGDKPWITVTPATGTLGPDGAVLTVTFAPAALALGTNTGTVSIAYGGSGKAAAPNAAAPSGVPVSVSLVTPVQPGGKNGPLPESLIIPAVGHAPGANNSLFESDVRIANTAAQLMKYQLNFTLTGANATQSGQSTTIQVDPGATMALDDILTNFFGIGSDGGAATGTLEIRPLTSSPSSLGTTAKTSIQTVASSRTFNTTPNGTYGQFIPAIPFAQFIGSTGGRISLQQVAQSAAYRTNFGLVEGAGENADVVVHVFDNAGLELAQIPISLLPGEHKQINGFLDANHIALTDGRIEVEVTSPTGKVTAYASTVDNATNDPLLVLPVVKGALTSTRYVLPGIADINNGFAAWRSDVRIFNGGTGTINVTLAYVPQPGNVGTSQTVTYTLPPNEVKALDNTLQSIFNLQNTGGALVMTTDKPSSLVTTARTFNQTANGTYGQFIPGVTPAESVGLGDRTLQVLQLETSTRFRTNIGVTETTGNGATVLVTAIPSDSKIAASTTLTLAPNEFRQFSLDSFGLGTLYNARVTVKVTAGSGKVTAYGSVIDQITQDPTYVPAQ